jgi:phenylalanyl-tRNA synthetase beta chain
LSTTPGSRNANWELVDRGREAAIRAGLVEIMTWSFIDTDDDALTATLPLCPGSPLELCNPLAQTQRIMRRSLLPGMLAAARGNLNQGERSLAIFEQGRVFYSDDPVGFFDLKGTIEAVLEMIGFPTVIWRRGGEPWFDESEGAVLSDAEGKILGCAGRLAAELIERWEIKQPVYAAELDLGAALADPPLAQFEELPRYPAVMADMTIEHTVELTFAELVDAVRGLAADRVETVDLRDRYAGENLSPDVVRTTLRLVYRHPDRSLTQEEVNDDQNRLREGLAERLGVKFA